MTAADVANSSKHPCHHQPWALANSTPLCKPGYWAVAEPLGSAAHAGTAGSVAASVQLHGLGRNGTIAAGGDGIKTSSIYGGLSIARFSSSKGRRSGKAAVQQTSSSKRDCNILIVPCFCYCICTDLCRSAQWQGSSSAADEIGGEGWKYAAPLLYSLFLSLYLLILCAGRAGNAEEKSEEDLVTRKQQLLEQAVQEVGERSEEDLVTRKQQLLEQAVQEVWWCEGYTEEKSGRGGKVEERSEEDLVMRKQHLLEQAVQEEAAAAGASRSGDMVVCGVMVV
ncbi:unnamed protein product, partial [Closterium sp. Yama58-4]